MTVGTIDAPAPAARFEGEAGTALTETALLAPIFVVILFAIIEFGLVFRDTLSIGDAVSDAARWEAVQGPDPREIEFPEGSGDFYQVSADYSAVRAVREATSGIRPEEIDRIVVYKVDAVDLRQDLSAVALVPDACKTGNSSSTANSCNMYPAKEAFLAVQEGQTDYFECDTGTERACGWDPFARNDGPAAAAIDYVGVYVKMRHDFVTGLFGKSYDFDRAKILRLEPGEVE
jgi:hypothetical protein